MSAEQEADTNRKPELNQGKKRKKWETPIDELFDLTQPIPKVDRPNKTEHDAQLKELTDAVEAIKEDRRKIQEKIDNAMSDPEGKASLQAARTKFNGLKDQKDALIDQQKAMRAQLDRIKNEPDKLVKDQKNARRNMECSSLEEIQKEISKLQRKQETTTMTRNAKKKLIKEMDALQASTKYAVQFKDETVAFDTVKEQRKAVMQQIGAKDKEIDAVSKEIDTVMATIKASEKREQAKDLIKKRDDFKKQIGDKIKEKDAIRGVFREKSNAWYNYHRAVKAQKRMQGKEDKKKP